MCRDKTVSTHVRQLGFILSMIPESLKELESLLLQYIEYKENYDHKMAEREEILKGVSLTSPRRNSKAFFFAEDIPTLNCRHNINASAVLSEYASLCHDGFFDFKRFRESPIVTSL